MDRCETISFCDLHGDMQTAIIKELARNGKTIADLTPEISLIQRENGQQQMILHYYKPDTTDEEINEFCGMIWLDVVVTEQGEVLPIYHSVGAYVYACELTEDMQDSLSDFLGVPFHDDTLLYILEKSRDDFRVFLAGTANSYPFTLEDESDTEEYNTLHQLLLSR